MKSYHCIATMLLYCAVSVHSQLVADACVDPSGFTSCMSAATGLAQKCYQQNCEGEGTCSGPDNCYSSNGDCVTICTSIAYQGWINCALSSCWNMAHSCEYQSLVVNAARACGDVLSISFPPYFSPPPTGAGSCSCPIGELYVLIRNTLPEVNACRAYTNDVASLGTDCACCGASHAVSGLAALCPTADPNSIPYFSSDTALQDALSVLENQQCVKAFASGNLDCTASPLNFSLPNNGQFYASSNVPNPGTVSISDLPGSVTAPLSATLVWSLFHGQVVTAVAASAAAVVTSSAVSPGSSGIVSSTASSGSSGGSGTSAASASSTSSAVTPATATGTAKSAAVKSHHRLDSSPVLILLVSVLMFSGL